MVKGTVTGKKYVHSVVSPPCHPSPELLSSCKMKTLSLLNASSPFPLIQPPAATVLLSVSTNLTPRSTVDKWDPTVFVFARRAYFTEHLGPEVRPHCSMSQRLILCRRMVISAVPSFRTCPPTRTEDPHSLDKIGSED